MALHAAPRTRTEGVYLQLRDDILNGHLLPGRRLPFGLLSERYGASTGVLREVLPRLVEQGLVVSEPQLGFRVMSVSKTDLCHLTELRVTLETLALRQAIEHGDLAWESRLLAVHHTLASTPPAGTDGTISAEWLTAHAGFHSALGEGGPNTRLSGLTDSLRAIAEVYRCWAAVYGDVGDRDVAAEHRRILEATLDRDADRAVAELTTHIERTAQILLDGFPGNETQTDGSGS